jgi:pantoate--beta-alanine ligase
MGNLHDGHMALLRLARRNAKRVVASTFVNPMQFGPNEDFNHYPRTPSRDSELLSAAGCDLLFQPDAKEIYPQGHMNATRIHVPELTDILCGAVRPGHFAGVASVVARLFNIVQPNVAIFGEKDFQQLAVIRRMATDLQIPVQIIGAPTVRAPDGLALSSRNQYLLPAERELAPRLYQELTRVADLLRAGESSREDIARHEAQSGAALDADGFNVEYFSVRSAETLRAPSLSTERKVVLVAARLGKARLIDNVQVALS